MRLNNLNITNTLIKANANLNILDAMGHTPGFYMVLYLELNIFKLLKHVFLNLI